MSFRDRFYLGSGDAGLMTKYYVANHPINLMLQVLKFTNACAFWCNVKHTLLPLKVVNLEEGTYVYPYFENEMLGILHATKKWHPQLIARTFKVNTYHDSLK